MSAMIYVMWLDYVSFLMSSVLLGALFSELTTGFILLIIACLAGLSNACLLFLLCHVLRIKFRFSFALCAIDCQINWRHLSLTSRTA